MNKKLLSQFIVLIVLLSFSDVYAAGLTSNQKTKYNKIIKNTLTNFINKQSNKNLDSQFKALNDLSSKLDFIIPTLKDEATNYVLTRLKFYNNIELKKIGILIDKEKVKKQQELDITAKNEMVQKLFQESSNTGVTNKESSNTGVTNKESSNTGVTNKESSNTGVTNKESSNTGVTNKESSNTGVTNKESSNTGVTNKERINILDMTLEFNQLIKKYTYYYDFFSYNKVNEENKIIKGDKYLSSYDRYINHNGIVYLYSYKGGKVVKLEDISIKTEELNNYLYFFYKSTISENITSKDYVFVIPKTDYEITKVNDSYTKIPQNLLIGDIHWDKYDIEVRTKYLKEIDNITQGIIAGKNSDYQRVKAIYDWVIQNVTYDYKAYEKTLSGEDKLDDVSYDQSGLATYMNKQGVCAGIAKLFVYMLSFAGVENVEYLTGHTFSGNFSFKIGHAWVRVGDYYYDPTWDLYTKDRNRFFRLPRDLMYASRSDKDDPNYSYYSGLSQSQLDKVMKDNYSYLIPKYKDQYYYHLEQYIPKQ